MAESKAFVLLSGGIDSSTALAIAKDEQSLVCGVSIDYGQRHKKEMFYARQQCDWFGVEHHVLAAGDILLGAMLTDDGQTIPNVRYDQIQGVSPTYVPFRNGLLLSIIAAFAHKWVVGAEPESEATIYFGAHAEDAHNWAYPDCTPEFIGSVANAIYIGTYRAVRLRAPFMWMQKHQIIREGFARGVDYSKTWSCYAGLERHCGECPTCYARQDAFARADIPDPTDYAVPRKAA